MSAIDDDDDDLMDVGNDEPEEVEAEVPSLTSQILKKWQRALLEVCSLVHVAF